MVANTLEERLDLEVRAPGDLDEELRKMFSDARRRKKHHHFPRLSAPPLSKLGAWSGAHHRKQDHAHFEDREEIYTRKHQDKRWARRDEV